MKVICVILLCLIISTSVPAYAESILWETKHSSTSLEKDQEWLLWVTTEEDEDIEDDVEDTASDIEDSEADPEADPEADSVAFIDATLVMEGTEAVPLEITMDSSTTDEIQEDAALEHTAHEEDGVKDGVEATPNDIQEYAAPEEDGVENTAPEEDSVDEIQPQTNP